MSEEITKRKVLRAEEVPSPDGSIAQRRSFYELNEDGSLACPKERLTKEEIELWHKIMRILKIIKLDRVVDGVLLMDLCKKNIQQSTNRKPNWWQWWIVRKKKAR